MKNVSVVLPTKDKKETFYARKKKCELFVPSFDVQSTDPPIKISNCNFWLPNRFKYLEFLEDEDASVPSFGVQNSFNEVTETK